MDEFNGNADVNGSRTEAQIVASLQPMERELVRRITAGFSLVQIAGELGIQVGDAVLLKAMTMQKVGAKATADLVRLGVNAASCDNSPPTPRVG